MTDFLSALLVFLLLCASAGFGIFVRPRLPAPQRDHDTVQMMMLVTGMLVSFSVLVLGLLTASIKTAYDNAGHHRQEYALQLTRLDLCLRDYGAGAVAARTDIRAYTAAVIASTWPHEHRPVGISYPDTTRMPLIGFSPVLAELIHRVGAEIDGLGARDPVRARVAEDCRVAYRDVLQARFSVIEDAQGAFSRPFYRILVFWLMVIFASFGLVAPFHGLSVLSLVLCAVSLSVALFVIVDLSHPYAGLFALSSSGMRAALASMMAP